MSLEEKEQQLGVPQTLQTIQAFLIRRADRGSPDRADAQE